MVDVWHAKQKANTHLCRQAGTCLGKEKEGHHLVKSHIHNSEDIIA